jgi:hypothetical protein
MRRITFRSQPGQIVCETLSQKKPNKHTKKGLVEWLKVEVLSSSPSTTKKKKKKKKVFNFAIFELMAF